MDSVSCEEAADDQQGATPIPPPRALRNAYSYFVEEQYATVRQQLNHDDSRAINSRLGEMWHELTEDEKAVYKRREECDLMRYEEEKRDWIRLHAGRPMGYLNRKRKDPDQPKCAQKPFLIFRHDMRPTLRRELPNVTAGARDQEIARRWRLLDDKSRYKYNRMSIKDQLRYAREMAAHRFKKLRIAQQRRRLEQLQASQQGPSVGPVPHPAENAAPLPAPGP